MKYVYQHAISSGIVLGGLGTGSLEIRADGCLHEWHIFNNGPWSSRREERHLQVMDISDSFFGVRVKRDKRITIRLLRARSYELGADPYRLPWLKPVDSIIFTGRPPLAFLEYSDERVDAKVSLEALSPFIPGDVKNSALPTALFKFVIENPTDDSLEVDILFAIRNPFSGLDKGVISSTSVRKEERYVAIIMSGSNLSPDHPMYNGSLVIATTEKGASSIAYVKKDFEALKRMWVDFRKDGVLDGSSEYEGADPHYGIITVKVKLDPKEKKEVLFILAWFFPNHIDEEGTVLGHMYENWFSSAEDVIKYVIENLNYLYDTTKKFHDVLYMDTNVEPWLSSLIGSQITTLQKATWFTKDGKFGIWEGYHDPYYAGPGSSAFNTTDVMYYASIMLLMLFPELEKKFLLQHAEWVLSPNVEPYYTLYALAIPENMNEFKKIVAKDPSIVTDFNKIKKAVEEIVKKTGKDPRGRIMHYFGHSLKRPDSYHMVDLMPKYILMVYRDALWTGDEKLIKNLWNDLKEIIECILRIHDPTGLKLPYHQTPAGFEFYNTYYKLFGALGRLANIGMPALFGSTFVPIGFQTFDVWSFLGIAAYTSILWLCALSAMRKVANELVKDVDYSSEISKILEEAKRNLYETLWNGEYFDLWYDPLSQKRDRACMAAQLAGQWYASALTDLGYVIDREKILATLRSIFKYNFIEDEGLINGVYPGGKRPAYEGDLTYPNDTGLPYQVGCQMDTPWTGVEFAVASHMIYEGLVDEGLRILKDVHERYVKGGHYWNQVEWGAHYMRPMSSWSVIIAIEGLLYDRLRGKLRVEPRINKENFKWIFTVPGAWGSVRHIVSDKEQTLSIELMKGGLEVHSIVLERVGESIKEVKVTIDGSEVKVNKVRVHEGEVIIELSKREKITKVLRATITYT